LASLLNGTRFNYVILGVAGNPSAVQKIVLTSRQSTGQVNAPQNSAQAQQAPVSPPEDEVGDDEVPPIDQQADGQPDDQQNGQFRRPGTLQIPQVQAGQPAEVSPDQVNGANGVKTPEQLLQELQRMQQMQQQYQQQLNPANQQPQPNPPEQ
jgi:hypothetical protein